MYLSLLSFQHQGITATANDVASLPFDMQDDMLRIWCFWFFFLPLDHHQDCVVQKNSSSKQQSSSSSRRAVVVLPSIWPYRLIQLQVIFIYTGTAWGKLLYSNEQSWIRGLEIWKSMHTHIFCITGAVIPNILFHKLLSLKVLAWSTLVLEHLALIFIWPLATRKWTVGVMVLFHVGIDVTMNMHIFEYVSILGWLFFLARPAVEDDDDDSNNDQDATTTTKQERSSPSPRWLTNPLIAVLILATWSNTNAAILWRHTLPPSMIPALRTYWEVSSWIQEKTKPWMGHLGCYQDPWLIFSGDVGGGGHVGYRYYAFIEYKEDEKSRPQSSHQDDDNTVDSRVVKTLTWASPDWMAMPWWEQKRHQRTMLFFENMGSTDDRATELAAYEGLCRELYLDYNNNGGNPRRKSILPGYIMEEGEVPNNTAMDVVSITLHLELSEGPSEPPHDLGLWDTPAIRQDLIETASEDVYYYSKEADILDKMDCTRRGIAGQCTRKRMARFMWENCVRTCSSLGFTNIAKSVHPGTTIVLYGERDTKGPYRVIRKEDEGFFNIRHEETGESSKVDLYVKYFGIPDADDSETFNDAEDVATSSDKDRDGMLAQVASARTEEL